MVVHMRVNRSKTGKRRSHHALKEPRLSKCECGAFHLRHRACQECGKYRGKQVVDVVARTERAQKRAKRKEQDLQASGQAPTENTTEEKKALKAPKDEKPQKKTTDKRKAAKESKDKHEA